jgi:hypothetical protein
MSFLTHTAGPGCITYAADVTILEIATQIMKDYFEQIKEQTETAVDCSEQMANCQVEAGNQEAQKAWIDSILKIAGSAVGIGCSITSVKGTIGQLKELGTNITGRSNIAETQSMLAKTPASSAVTQASAALDAAPKKITVAGEEIDLTPERRLKIQNAITEHKYETKALEAISWKDADGKEFTMSKNEIGGLPPDIKNQIAKDLESQNSILQSKANEIDKKIANWTTIGNMASSLSSLIDSIGPIVTQANIKEKAQYDAARTMISQAQEFTKQTDSINTQGAQQAFDQMQKALQAYMSVVSANTRA